jgi:hypothetical protein
MLLNYSLKTTTMKKNKKQLMIDAFGNGAREVYLEKNPHGFASVNKVHKSKKAYNRNNKVRFVD